MDNMGKTGGFTLIELVFVLMLLGLLGTFLFYDQGGQEIPLRAQAEQVASDIRYVQNLGMTKGARYRINFSNSCVSSETACYWISNADDTVKISNPASNADEVALTHNITLLSTHSALLFNGKGAPFSTSGTAITSNAVITLSLPGETSRTIAVNPETGYVVVQ
ncbi:MAG: hypothetical protein K0R12_300 [Gammaproteobacteria bacterium]|jgi:prepilin-type N-terminal cleavage/methylation domain-containing protein|nr:hypothetical protein [Gammaproteobacteria bacterium]